MEPVSLVSPQHLARLTLDDEAFLLPQCPLNELIIIHLPEEAYPLAISAFSTDQVCFFRHFSDLTLEQMPRGEEELPHLSKINLR